MADLPWSASDTFSRTRTDTFHRTPILPDGPINRDVILNFCHFVTSFATEGVAREWVAGREGTFEILGVEEAYRLVQTHNRALPKRR